MRPPELVFSVKMGSWIVAISLLASCVKETGGKVHVLKDAGDPDGKTRLMETMGIPSEYMASGINSCEAKAGEPVTVLERSQLVPSAGGNRVVRVLAPGFYKDTTCMGWLLEDLLEESN